MGMLAVAKDKLDRKLRRRKLQGGSGVSPLAASDPITGLYYERARWYRTGQAGLRQEPKSSRRIGTGAVHREISQDPLSYTSGANTYQFVLSNPVDAVDPSGLSWYNPASWGWVQDAWGAVTAPVRWVGDVVDFAAKYHYASGVEAANRGANGRYWHSIVYGRNNPNAVYCIDMPAQVAEAKGVARVAVAATKLPNVAGNGPPEMPTGAGDYAKAVAKDFLKSQASK
jgi:hypothetical protein